MRQDSSFSRLLPALLRMICAVCMLQPITAISGSIDLTNVPLSTATTSEVKPNLMFILDNSGSMNWDYLPDLVVDGNYCKGSASTGTSYRCCRNSSGTNLSSNSVDSTCLPSKSATNLRGMPPFYSSDFNKAYYDPAITYSVPLNYDGTKKTSYDSGTGVPLDGYKIQTSDTMNLTTSYPDVEWCTDNSYSDCLRNGNYLLPGKINGKSYTTMHAITVSTAQSSNFATGTVTSPSTTTGLAGPFYYVIVPGEYCSDAKQTDCKAATAPDATYKFAAKLRWCNDSGLSTCKATQDSTYNYPRYPTIVLTASVSEIDSVGDITIDNMPQSSKVNGNRPTGTGATCNGVALGSQAVVTSIKLGGTELLSGGFTYCDGDSSEGTRNKNLAREIASRITNGFTASRNGAVITVTAPTSAYNNATLSYTINSANNGDNPRLYISDSFSNGKAGSDPVAVPGSFKRIDIVSGQTYGNIISPDGTIVVDKSGRTDCASAPNCTYAEELKNFSNWFAWYRTRMQMMKTVVSRAFNSVDNRYRVGFYTINYPTNNYLKINTFEAGVGGQKQDWYAKLAAADPDGSTPLRSTLANVGRIFAGKNPHSLSPSDDPMQYSCQQNFAFLTTDGYWNSDTDTSTIKNIKGQAIPDQDGSGTPRPMYQGSTATSNTLADVARYYYVTDIRDETAFNNCTGSLGVSVCANNVIPSGNDTSVYQHMTTFTLGLGVDGTLQYASDYNTASTGDFASIKSGGMNWPVPVSDTATAVDDLWHAAVNGGGTYFSAKNPDQLSKSINSVLASIDVRHGAGAAAATSSLNPISNDNFAYVASYTTGKWTGNLEARSICLTDDGSCGTKGSISQTANWCVESIDSPACSGKLGTSVSGTSDTRTIFFNKNGTLTSFTYENLTNGQKDFFSSLVMQNLSQWSSLLTDQRTNATGANLVNFLRGQTGYEDRTSNDLNKRIFRARDATLGDAMEAEPAFVGKPAFDYIDTGYSEYKTAKASRAKTIYLGANDGMLHAINAEDGTERWSFIPSMVMQNLWKLADKNYSGMHSNFVNGSPRVYDAYNGTEWRTILVAGLNGGGRGYYALDITNPTSPSLLWEIDSNTDADIGYTYGQPYIVKKSNGTWVVIFTSGYNNTSPGNGKGYLYVRDAFTGAVLPSPQVSKISTDTGSTDTPSGLGKISGWSDDPMKISKVKYVYGGDLLGNVWRFNIEDGSILKFAELKDESSPVPLVQPITTAPELGLIDKKRVVFVATGKYLERSDLSNTQVQSVYAIMDDNATSTLSNPRSALVRQTITTSGSTRTGSTNTVDWSTKRGWYVDLPDSGERVHVNPKLDAGTLIVASTVPESSECTPGGYSWLNFFRYGSFTTTTNNIVSEKYGKSPIVGVNVYYIDNKRFVAAVTADDPTPKLSEKLSGGLVGGGFTESRGVWRELTP